MPGRSFEYVRLLPRNRTRSLNRASSNWGTTWELALGDEPNRSERRMAKREAMRRMEAGFLEFRGTWRSPRVVGGRASRREGGFVLQSRRCCTHPRRGHRRGRLALPAPHELSAGALHVPPAAPAHGDEAAVLVEARRETLDARFRGLAEGGVGVLVHGDQVDRVAVAQLPEPVGQTVGVLQRVVHPGEEAVL